MENNKKSKIIVSLFLSFFKVGAFTFGGGYAMIALLQNEFVLKKKWIDEKEFLDIVAIAESTPGPIAINAATYIGYKMAGIAGSIFSTIGVALPSLIIIYIISLFFDTFLKIKYVSYVFKGVSAAVIYLILSAAVKMFKSLDKSIFNCFLFGLVLIFICGFSFYKISFSSIYFILICGVAGIILYYVKRSKGGDKK